MGEPRSAVPLYGALHRARVPSLVYRREQPSGSCHEAILCDGLVVFACSSGDTQPEQREWRRSPWQLDGPLAARISIDEQTAERFVSRWAPCWSMRPPNRTGVACSALLMSVPASGRTVERYSVYVYDGGLHGHLVAGITSYLVEELCSFASMG